MENEGTGMTTDRPSFTIPYGTFLKFLRPGSRLPVAAVKQLLDVGRTVQYLAAQPGEGKQTCHGTVAGCGGSLSAFQPVRGPYRSSRPPSPVTCRQRDAPWKRRRSTVEKNSLMLAALTGEQTVIGIHHDLIFLFDIRFHGLSDRPSHTFSPLAASSTIRMILSTSPGL